MRSLRAWMRDLHLYVGLAASPFILVYALSTIVLNHPAGPWGPAGEPDERTVAVRLTVPADASSLAIGREVLRQTGVSGEIMYVNRDLEAGRLVAPVQRPGETVKITVDLARQEARIERRRTSFWARLVMWHKMPGPHVVDLRGNWAPVAFWRWLADGTVCAILALAASGLYLWAALRSERKVGLLCVSGGAAAFGLVIAGVVL